MNYYPKYYNCKKCGQIEPISTWLKVGKRAIKCIYCKSSKKIMWPNDDVKDLLDFILSYDVSQSKYSQVVPVFLCSAVELMLEKLLTIMAFMDLSYHDGFVLVDALIDSHQGRSKMLDLYRRIGHTSFHAEVKELGFNDYNKKWDGIVETRNKIVHGKIKNTPSLDSNYVFDFVCESLEVFRLLHNKYNQESLQYDIATKSPKKRMDEEIQKLILDRRFIKSGT